jgi:hypothetical protein
MLVILLGTIGDMLLSGIIGLFIEVVILALGYELFIAWLDKSVPKVEPAGVNYFTILLVKSSDKSRNYNSFLNLKTDLGEDSIF